MPISAILFGGRRAHERPARQPRRFDWQHGVFLGSIMASETTAAAAGAVGDLRRDPFAMLPFCGYNMGDYFGHWLEIGQATDARQAAEALLGQLVPQGRRRQFLWPGFGENSRVLKWVFERVAGEAEAVETPIGLLPTLDAIDDRRARPRPRPTWSSCSSVDLERLARGGPAHRGALRAVRRPPAGRAARPSSSSSRSASPADPLRCAAWPSSAYILIQTEVGKAAKVAIEVGAVDGVVAADDVTGPYDVIARAEAATVDDLGRMVVSRIQMIDGITRTLTCPVVNL